jgi:hypothetical protein
MNYMKSSATRSSLNLLNSAVPHPRLPLVAKLGVVVLLVTGMAMALNPVPLIMQTSPDFAAPGGAAFVLTVNGTGFVSGAAVLWNGSARATTFVSSSQLTASILATDISTARTASVTVVNPAPGGGTSNVAFFNVTKPINPLAITRSDFASGQSPQAVVVADFNGDGKQDIAVLNGNANTVSIFLGNGDGTFQTPLSSFATAPGNPVAAVAGDFNNDGKLDLAIVVERVGEVSILLGNGDGTFQSHQDFVVGNNPLSLNLGDFNGDGNLDIVVANANDNTVSVLLGNGNGTFANKADYATGGHPKAVAVGDMNGDGFLDLVTANNNDNTVSVLLGNGSGTFASHSDFTTAALPTSVAVGDFNKDGKLDVAISSASTKASVLLGNGDGTLGTHTDYNIGLNAQWLIASDLNADGKLDLVIANFGENSVSVLQGNGDGTFKTANSYPTNGGPGWIATGDFNGDGKPDLAIPASTSNTISILLQGTTTLSPTLLVWGNQQAGVASTAKTVTLKNGGTTVLNINTKVMGGPNAADFAQTNTCGTSIAAGASCTFSVTFTPDSMGPKTGQFVVTFTDGSSVGFGMTGSGIISITLTPRNITFKPQLLNTASKAVPVSFTNLSGVTITISSVLINGINPTSYAQTGTCGSSSSGSSLPAGQTCTMNVTFTPLQTGGLTAALNIFGTFTAGQGQQASLMTGTGTAVSVTPTSLTFAAQTVGTTSTSKAVTMKNVGSTAMSVTSITFAGTDPREFAQTNTCMPSIPAGGSCTVSVTFTPAAIGARTATMSIGDPDPTGPQIINLTGTGQ